MPKNEACDIRKTGFGRLGFIFSSWQYRTVTEGAHESVERELKTRMAFMNTQKVSANPLISYFVLCVMSALALIMYLLAASGYGTFNVNLWRPYDGASVVMLSSILLFVGIGFYVVREYGVDLKVVIESQLNIKRARKMRYLSLLSKHYGCFYSMTKMLVLGIVALKMFAPVVGVFLVSILMTFVLTVYLGVYSVNLSRTLYGSWNRHPVQVLALLGIIATDAVALVVMLTHI